jgi:hypothetical protein
VGDLQDPTAAVIVVQKPDETEVGYKTSTGWTDKTTWNATTNVPSLANGTGTAGWYYTVDTAGSVDFGDGSITFAVDDQVFYNGDVWHKLPSPIASTLTNSGTGIYYIDQPVAQSGTWYYRSEGVGTGQAGADENFTVRESQF